MPNILAPCTTNLPFVAMECSKACRKKHLARSPIACTPKRRTLCAKNCPFDPYLRHTPSRAGSLLKALKQQQARTTHRQADRLSPKNAQLEHGRCAALRWACGLGLGSIGDHALFCHLFTSPCISLYSTSLFVHFSMPNLPLILFVMNFHRRPS